MAVHICGLFKDQQEVVTVHWAIVQIKHRLFSLLCLTFNQPLNLRRILLSTQKPRPRLRTNPSAHSRGGPAEVAEIPFTTLKLNIRTSSFRSALQDRTG